LYGKRELEEQHFSLRNFFLKIAMIQILLYFLNAGGTGSLATFTGIQSKGDQIVFSLFGCRVMPFLKNSNSRKMQ
jgi:hypothetical protein